MFSHADRIPVQPARERDTLAPRPWGLSRMAPFLHISEYPSMELTIDPVTQLACRVGPDGRIMAGDHRRSNTGTEVQTSQNKGDGSGPAQYDDDHSQDSDQD